MQDVILKNLKGNILHLPVPEVSVREMGTGIVYAFSVFKTSALTKSELPSIV